MQQAHAFADIGVMGNDVIPYFVWKQMDTSATISTIAKGIIIPKLLYGIELSETTNSFLSLINTQLRDAIKSL